MTIKKRAGGGGGASSTSASGPPKKRTTTTRRAGSPAATSADAKRADAAKRGPAKRSVAKRSAPQPRIRASHGTVPDAPASSAGGRSVRAISADIAAPRLKALKGPGAGPRKAPLSPPKRPAAGRAPRQPGEAAPEARGAHEVPSPSSAARELALALAAAAIEKKAIAIEILDVTGKVDYADFLLVMTGRSDRHVHSIATGIEEEMRKKKLAPLSMEGLTSSTWVLIDFGDVVVHVFQEEARALYDIEGLWIDAGRVPVPPEEGVAGGPASGPKPRGAAEDQPLVD